MSSPKPNFVDVSNQGRKSIIWQYLWQDKESENSECQLCKQKGISKILFTKGRTKTALDHLKHIHGITGKSNKVNDDNKTNIFEKRETVEEAVTKLCIDGISFNTIANSEMLQKLGKNYQYAPDKKTGKPKTFPSSHTTVRKYTIDHSLEIEDKVRKSLDIKKKNGDRMSITLDEWSSKGFKKYLNLNVHHGRDEYDCLGLSRCKGSLPAPKLTQLVVDHANKFNLDLSSDVVAVVTDGASIMDIFGKSIPSIHLKCQCHAANLAVRDILYPKETKKKKSTNISSQFTEVDGNETLDNVDDSNAVLHLQHEEPEGPELLSLDWIELVTDTRGLVSLFRKSPVKNEEFLQEFVVASHGKEFTLILDCKTRLV